MLRKTTMALVLASLPALSAHAGVILAAKASLSGTASDLSGLSYTLENGQPANLLGGFGSAIAWAGGNTFIATPDRGPNALAYNTALDNTTSYIDRLQTFSLTLNAAPSGSSLPFVLNPVLQKTTLLSSTTPLYYGSGAGLGVGNGAPALNATTGLNYFTGRSDNYDPSRPSSSTLDARFDPEGVRVARDGKSVFISDEYGPYVYQFDRATGQRIRSFALPDNLAVKNLSPSGDAEISGNTSGRVANKGMEGLAITPDGKTLVGIMQAPLIQDGGNIVRIVSIDIATGTTREYAYQLTDGSGVSEIVAINDHEFLVDERDGKGLGDGTKAKVKKVYRIDLAGATDVTALSGAAALTPYVVNKSSFLDVRALLNAAGIADADIPAKIEGLAFGDDINIGGTLKHTLFVTSDNDFTNSLASSFYVFAFDNADLPGFQAQVFDAAEVPEPATAGIVLSALGALAWSRRRVKK